MFKYVLFCAIISINSVGYAQFPSHNDYYFHGFITNWNPSNFYYPGFIPGQPDFQPIPDTPVNRQRYPGVFELQRLQKANQLKAKRMFPELIPPKNIQQIPF